jgi:hypothetical protein
MMEVHINNLTSTVHLADARAMLTPEVLQQIVEAVLTHLRQEEQQRQARERDMNIDRRASDLD